MIGIMWLMVEIDCIDINTGVSILLSYLSMSRQRYVEAVHHVMKEVDLYMFVDSNHAGDKQTRRSRTRFMIYMNTSSIHWYFKKQL